jgi:23S rRNA (guanosine2251-2'-O)-methyltransferase
MRKVIGRKPVLEAIISGEEIDRIIISFGQKRGIIDSILTAAKRKKIKVSQLSPQKFKENEKGLVTQGVMAFINDLNMWEPEALISQAKKNDNPLILIIDEIQDTHNLGAIFRSAEASGVDGIIMTQRNTAPLNETVEKTSAGAISHLRISQVSNLFQAIELLKQNGFWIYGSSLGDNSKNYTEHDYKGAVAIVVGNEEKGIRRSVAENCDHLVKIPMMGKTQSLNVSVATGVILFEVVRQRANLPE